MFKKYTGPLLTRQEAISQLEKIQKLGYDVYQKDDNSFLIKINDSKEIVIIKRPNKWIVRANKDGLPVYIKNPSTLALLISFLNEAASELNVNIGIRNVVKSVRINSNQPLSNKVKIISLIQDRKITGIFDPYFDTKSILTLHALAKLGLKFNTSVKCLTKKPFNSIDQSILNDFENEFSIDFKIKKCVSKEHRRFFILDSNTIIIIGCSLNDIDKNEVVVEEINKDLNEEDIKFFNEEWNK